MATRSVCYWWWWRWIVYILSRVGVTFDWVLNWILDLVTTYRSELQVMKAPLLISTHHKSSYQTRSILQPALFTSRSLATASNSRDSSAYELKSSVHSLPYSYVTTDGQSASLSWYKTPMWGLRPDLYFCQAAAGLLIWGVLSDERTGLSFARYSDGPIFFLINHLLGPSRKHRFEKYLYCCMRSRCLETVLVCLLMSRSLRSNSSTHYNIIPNNGQGLGTSLL
jgi:hypothetical protein